MTAPFNPILSGTFTSNGTSQSITVPSDIIKMELYNETYFGSTAATTNMETAFWIKDLADGSAYVGNKTNGAATIAITSMITSGGFTLVNPTTTSATGASIVTTATTAANPAVVSTGTTTNLVAGSSVVRIINNTNMQQISGMDFTVGTVSAGVSFQLKFLDASGFAAAGTTGAYRIVNLQGPYYPKRRFITKITQASSAVITMSVTHGFTVGQLVRIYVPAAFGMVEMNGQLGQITAIDTTNNTITVNINSTNFTAFAFPTSATAAAGVTFAQVVPVGEAASGSGPGSVSTFLDDATVNQGNVTMNLGSSVLGANNDVIRWIAYRALV